MSIMVRNAKTVTLEVAATSVDEAVKVAKAQAENSDCFEGAYCASLEAELYLVTLYTCYIKALDSHLIAVQKWVDKQPVVHELRVRVIV